MSDCCSYEIETKLSKINYRHICGIDEVGRGAIFGPVVAGAVSLDPKKLNPDFNDSKKLTEKRREQLEPIIKEHALAWALGRA